MKTGSRDRSGSALMIILPLVALLALMTVFILRLSMFDSHLANNSFEQNRAASVTKYALDDAASKINSIPLDRHWAAGPGRIRYCSLDGTWPLANRIDLYSGDPGSAPAISGITPTSNPDLYLDGATADKAAKYINLNTKLEDGSYTIIPKNTEYDSAPEMEVPWVYVLQDGTTQTDPSRLPPTGVVGRYAYWTDVENGRVNINTAGFGMVNPPGSRFISTAETEFNSQDEYSFWYYYSNNVWAINPWMTDKPTSTTLPLFSALDRSTAQLGTPQNLTAHPSSIDLSFLDDVSVQQSFDSFRYAGSYFLRADARNSYAFCEYPSNNIVNLYSATPDLSVRFFREPKDWKLIVNDATYQENKGYITVQGRSPEINPWGLPKIPLSLPAVDGSPLNDLTDNYNRTVPPAGGFDDEDATRDTRRVEVIPSQSEFGGWMDGGPLPWALVPGRSIFRDITAFSSIYTSNRNYIETLMYDMANILDTPMPGYSSFTSKFTPSERDQITLETIGYVDACLGTDQPGWAKHSVPYSPYQSANQYNPYGTNFPEVGSPTAPATEVYRSPVTGQVLPNELKMTVQAATYASMAVPDWAVGHPEWNYGDKNPNMQPGTVTQYANTPVVTNSNVGVFYLLRQPLPNDMFIVATIAGEATVPAHFGFLAPSSRASGNYPLDGFVGNSAMSWISNDNPVGITPVLSGSLNYDVNGTGGSPAAGEGPLAYGAVSILKYYYPALVPLFNGNSYPMMTASSNHPVIYIGPFTPDTTISDLHIKARMLFNFQTQNWEVIPGIVQKGSADPNDSSITSTFLDFHFQNLNTSDLISFPQEISCEATDPRVTRKASNWTPSQQGDFGTEGSLGGPNSTYTGSMDDSNVSRPPMALSYIRSISLYWYVWNVLGHTYLSPRQSQTASCILGLPGVGYLSGVPTGVDRGQHFSTFKFYKNSTGEDPPDWLLWNLFYVPFDRSMSNQTDGKMNINAKLYPFKAANGTDDLVREKPLEALLGNRVTAATRTQIATHIAAGPVQASLPADLYVYAGQICDVAGVADDTSAKEYDREQLPRDIADIVTTQSSDYRVFSIAQTLKQTASGQIVPIATQRSEATISRAVDVGPQGYAFSGRDGASADGNPPWDAFNPSVYFRSQLRPSGTADPAATLHKLVADGLSTSQTPQGTNRIPNDDDDWILPQKVEISHFSIVK